MRITAISAPYVRHRRCVQLLLMVCWCAVCPSICYHLHMHYLITGPLCKVMTVLNKLQVGFMFPYMSSFCLPVAGVSRVYSTRYPFPYKPLHGPQHRHNHHVCQLQETVQVGLTYGSYFVWTHGCDRRVELRTKLSSSSYKPHRWTTSILYITVGATECFTCHFATAFHSGTISSRIASKDAGYMWARLSAGCYKIIVYFHH